MGSILGVGLGVAGVVTGAGVAFLVGGRVGSGVKDTTGAGVPIPAGARVLKERD